MPAITTIKIQQKRFYDRETFAALNYQIHQMSFIQAFPSIYATQIINTFLNSRISANQDKVDGLLFNREIHLKEIVSLL